MNKHGRAGWQGNEISSKEAFRGRFDREVNKKRKYLLPLSCMVLGFFILLLTFLYKVECLQTGSSRICISTLIAKNALNAQLK